MFLLASIGATISLLASAQGTEADRDRARDAVVMLRTQGPDGGAFGAGIVVAASAQDAYVVTASHLVRGRSGTPVSTKLQFHSRPGEWFDGRVLDLTDRDLDLAALVVRLPPGVTPAALRGAGAAAASQLSRGANVYPIGFTAERAWSVPVVADKVMSTSVLRVVFQSQFVRPGNSGGALLDACGRIVGMVTALDSPEAEALRIESVLKAVENWSLPVPATLVLSTSTCASESRTVSPSGALPQPQTPVRPQSRAETTTIKLAYSGDVYACSLQLKVKIGEKIAVPMSNLFSIRDVSTGVQPYTVTGQIGCPGVGVCAVRGAGTIDVRENATYSVIWRNTAYAQCNVSLIEQ